MYITTLLSSKVNWNLQLCKLQELQSRQKLLVNAPPTELNKFVGYESVNLCNFLMYYLQQYVHLHALPVY